MGASLNHLPSEAARLLTALLIYKTSAFSRWPREQTAANEAWGVIDAYLLETESIALMGARKAGDRAGFDRAMTSVLDRLGVSAPLTSPTSGDEEDDDW